ncbi:MAG: hypothetical protein L3J21_11385 [Devosiaceae bacterium]|nr:hypothetical protein [Devosiaceae bacterium]
MNKQAPDDFTLKIVGPTGVFPRVKLIDPVMSGYLYFGLEFDNRPLFTSFLESGKKKRALKILKKTALHLRTLPDIIDVAVFKTLITPPGRGEFIKQRPGVEIASFDVVMLVEFATPKAARAFKSSKEWQDIVASASKEAKKQVTISATNARRMGPVDHSRKGVFLFNYFYADNLEQLLGIWEYTAGWFSDQTGLDNSTLLLPDEGQDRTYTIINHCRWDSLGDIVPSLIFKKSFHTFVEANFVANNVAPIPILYKLA